MKTIVGLWIVPCLLLAGCVSHNQNDPGSAPQGDNSHSSGSATLVPNEPLKADTRYAAGQLAETQGAFDAAVKQYKAALEIDPKHLPSIFRLGVVLTAMKQYPEAIETWQKYLVATNGSAVAYGNLGFCYQVAGQYDEAEAAYQKGIAKDSANVPCRTNYGLMLARRGHIPEAIRIWQPVLRDADIHYNLASVYEMENRKLEAKSEYRKALDADPKFSDAKQRLAEME